MSRLNKFFKSASMGASPRPASARQSSGSRSGSTYRPNSQRLNAPLFHGWLQKRGDDFKKKWQFRYFVLVAPGTLQYYTDQTMEEKKGEILLHNATEMTLDSSIAPPPPSAAPAGVRGASSAETWTVVTITMPGRVYVLAAPTPGMAEQWREACLPFVSQRAQIAETEYDYEGWLYTRKKREALGWKKRYVRLRGTTFTIYRDDETAVAKGSIDIGDALVNVVGAQGKTSTHKNLYRFRMTFGGPPGEDNEIDWAAEEEDARGKWLETIASNQDATGAGGLLQATANKMSCSIFKAHGRFGFQRCGQCGVSRENHFDPSELRLEYLPQPKEGWLYVRKRSKKRVAKSWKRRYARLTGNVLSWFKDREDHDSNYNMIIDLFCETGNYDPEEDQVENLQRFAVRTAGSTFILAVESDDERRSWVDALLQVQILEFDVQQARLDHLEREVERLEAVEDPNASEVSQDLRMTRTRFHKLQAQARPRPAQMLSESDLPSEKLAQLRAQLETGDDLFCRQFLARGGMTQLSAVMQRLQRFASMEQLSQDSLIQLTHVTAALRAVMNHDIDAVIKDGECVRLLTMCTFRPLRVDNLLAAAEVLTAVVVVSEAGREAMLSVVNVMAATAQGEKFAELVAPLENELPLLELRALLRLVTNIALKAPMRAERLRLFAELTQAGLAPCLTQASDYAQAIFEDCNEDPHTQEVCDSIMNEILEYQQQAQEDEENDEQSFDRRDLKCVCDRIDRLTMRSDPALREQVTSLLGGVLREIEMTPDGDIISFVGGNQLVALGREASQQRITQYGAVSLAGEEDYQSSVAAAQHRVEEHEHGSSDQPASEPPSLPTSAPPAVPTTAPPAVPTTTPPPTGAPVPPPMPGMGGAPVPPPLPGMGGAPMPPPLPGMGGPPMPPPMPGMPMPPPLPGMGGPPMPPGMPQAPPPELGPKPERKMKALFWDKLPQVQVAKTFWASADITPDDYHLESHLTELYDGFAVQAARRKAVKTPEQIEEERMAAEAEDLEVKLLKPQRAMNIFITLAKLQLQPEQLSDAILGLDLQLLDKGKLELLKQLLPDPDETKLLKLYSTDRSHLRQAEVFLLALTDIPRVTAKVKCLEHKHLMHDRMHELQAAVHQVHVAAREVLESERLKRLLGLLMVLGNFLNYGTSRGGAQGVKLTLLEKAANLKSANPKRAKSLLHVAIRIADKEDSSLVSIGEDMPMLKTVSTMDVHFLQREVLDFHSDALDVKAEVAHAMRSEAESDFAEALAPFAEIMSVNASNLKDKLREALDLVHQVAETFGEDAKSDPSALFRTFDSFNRSVAAAVQDNERLDVAEAKRQAQEARAQARAEVMAARRAAEPSSGEEGAAGAGAAAAAAAAPGSDRVGSLLRNASVSRMVSAEEAEATAIGLRRAAVGGMDDSSGDDSSDWDDDDD